MQRFGPDTQLASQSKGEIVMDILNEMNNKTKLLDLQVANLGKTGRDYAKAYTEYRVALAKELVKLKDEGYAITLAGDIARGKPEIARLKFQEIAAEALYKANLESINCLKLEIKILQSQIDKEWAHNE